MVIRILVVPIKLDRSIRILVIQIKLDMGIKGTTEGKISLTKPVGIRGMPFIILTRISH